MVREAMPEKEDIWHFGPFLFLSVPEWIWKLSALWQAQLGDVAVVYVCRGDGCGRSNSRLQAVPEHWLFSYHPSNWGYSLLVVMSSMMCVAMAIKIWNNTRIEMNLERISNCC